MHTLSQLPERDIQENDYILVETDGEATAKTPLKIASPAELGFVEADGESTQIILGNGTKMDIIEFFNQNKEALKAAIQG